MSTAALETFHEQRRGGIGGSDVGAILGCEDAFHSELEVALEKTGALAPKDISEEPRVWWGTATEEIHARRYALDSGTVVQLHSPDFVVHPEEPILRCHPDARSFRANSVRRLVELKWVAADQRHTFDDGPPLAKVLQVQHNLGVCLAAGVVEDTVADLSVVFGGCERQTFEVAFDEEFFTAWRMKAREWWDSVVVQGRLPEPTHRDLDAVKRRFAHESGGSVHLSSEFESYDHQLVQLKADRDRIKKCIAEIEARFITAIGAASVGVLPNGDAYTLKTIKRAGYTAAPSEYRQLCRKGER